jgi:hypothetical protein
MTRTNKILAAVVAVGLAVGAFYFLALAPKREEIAKLDTDVAAKEAELAQAQQTLVGYEQARKTYKSNYTTLARLGKAVPADDDVRSLMVQLQSTAERSGVDFEKIELGTGLAGGSTSAAAPAEDKPATGELASAPGAVPVAGGAMSAMPFSFTFNGGFFDLSTFFSRLEHYVTVKNERVNVTGRLMRVESISLAPAGSGFPNMAAQIGAATYIVPPAEGVAGATPAAGAAPATPSASGSTPPTTTATAGAAG